MKTDKENKLTTTIRLERVYHSFLKAESKRQGLTFTRIVENMVQREIDKG